MKFLGTLVIIIAIKEGVNFFFDCRKMGGGHNEKIRGVKNHIQKMEWSLISRFWRQKNPDLQKIRPPYKLEHDSTKNMIISRGHISVCLQNSPIPLSGLFWLY